MSVIEETYDVCVVGAGHAGCEAALACARMGLETIIFTAFALGLFFALYTLSITSFERAFPPIPYTVSVGKIITPLFFNI